MKRQLKSLGHRSRAAFYSAMAIAATVTVPGMANAALPTMEAPTRGEGNGIMTTGQNYAFDMVGLIALVICACMFCGVAWHSYTVYSEVQTGKKTWGNFGLTVSVGAILLVICIWLLSKANGIL